MSAASAESSGVGGLAASVVAGGGAREPGSGRLRRAGRSAAAVGRRELASKWHGAGGSITVRSLDGLQCAQPPDRACLHSG